MPSLKEAVEALTPESREVLVDALRVKKLLHYHLERLLHAPASKASGPIERVLGGLKDSADARPLLQCMLDELLSVQHGFQMRLGHVARDILASLEADSIVSCQDIETETDIAKLNTLAMSHEDPEIRAAATTRMANVAGKSSINRCRLQFHDPSPLVVGAALKALGMLAPKVATTEAVALLKEGQKGNQVRQIAADLLAAQPWPKTALLRLMETPPHRSAANARQVARISALALLRQGPEEALERCCNTWLKPDGVANQAPFYRDAINTIAWLAAPGKNDTETITEARRSFAELLPGCLPDAHPDVRAAVLWGLRQAQHPEALERARSALSDTSEDVRMQAVKTLSKSPEKDDLVALLTLLGDSREAIRDVVKGVSRAQASTNRDLFREHLVEVFRIGPDSTRRHALEIVPWCFGKEDIPLVARLIHAPDESTNVLREVRHAPDPDLVKLALEAIRTLAHPDPAPLLELAPQVVKRDDPDVLCKLLDLLNRLPMTERTTDVARRLTKHRNGSVAAKAMAVLFMSAPHNEVLLLARKFISAKPWELRKESAEILGELGAPCDVQLLKNRLTDEDSDVRTAALEALQELQELAPDATKAAAIQLLTDESERLAGTALNILKKQMTVDNLVELALKKLRRARGDSGEVLWSFLKKPMKSRLPELQNAGLQSRNCDVRMLALEMLADEAETGPYTHISEIEKLLKDRASVVRSRAFKLLAKQSSERAQELALQLLDDPSSDIKLQALGHLADVDDPDLVNWILPLARDNDYDVREEALKFLIRYDDPRVYAELVSSLNDVDGDVREAAQDILDGKHGDVPALQHQVDAHGDQPWQTLRERVEAINAWASAIGQELLGKPVRVDNYRQGLGRTGPGCKNGPITIEVSDASVTTGHPQGEDIMCGLALHEIGHHLCDYGARGHSTMRGIARSEGVDYIFDVLTDERLERVLRSRRDEWGHYFDRLASYAFAQDTHLIPLDQLSVLLDKPQPDVEAWIEAGPLRGQLRKLDTGQKTVAFRDSDMLTIPGCVPPQAAFLACLRCGFDPNMCADAVVKQAIDLIPRDLRDISHRDVLEAARAIGQVLGTTKTFKQRMKRLRQQAGAHRKAWAALLKALDRMTESGQLPEWTRTGANAIRVTPVPATNNADQSARIKMPGWKVFNKGLDEDFSPLLTEQTLPYDPVAHAALVAPIRKNIRRLRAYFERLGTRIEDQYASRRGRRLDLAQVKSAAVRQTPNVLVHSYDIIAPDAYVGILIDKSGSMHGEKMELAKRFGALVAESISGLRGVDGHVNAFDDDTLYRLGSLKRPSISALEAGGGNNDSGAMALAADLAMRSKRKNRLLIMISDGSPSECTFASLKQLVSRLTHDYGIVCAQVAVEPLDEIAFPHYVDLSQYPMDEAVARFGALIVRLTAAWR